MTKLVLSSQTICSNDSTFILSFVEKKPSLIVKISSVCSQDPTDSGCETSTPLSPSPGVRVEEPAIQKRLVAVEESVDDALLEELFQNDSAEEFRPLQTQVRLDSKHLAYFCFRKLYCTAFYNQLYLFVLFKVLLVYASPKQIAIARPYLCMYSNPNHA